MRALIRRLARHSTILFSTHILSEVEALCDRVVILLDGQVRSDARLADLAATSDAVLVLAERPQGAAEALRRLPGVQRRGEPDRRRRPPGATASSVAKLTQTCCRPSMDWLSLRAGHCESCIATYAPWRRSLMNWQRGSGMKQTLAVTRKELAGYFGSPMALIFVGVFLAVTLFSFFWLDIRFSPAASPMCDRSSSACRCCSSYSCRRSPCASGARNNGPAPWRCS